ncbi:DUF3300 domain-containing protein [Rhodopila sp.]|uniref:DUF3300 domain-containing protein n=1 Tax=Rhodopila sp. TaxID=2480087 RepID=UPI003D0DA6EE
MAQAPPSAQAAATAQVYSQAELEQILAPIALYPDELLTQVLVASTYPLEVVTASRWVQQPANKALKGDALLKALDAQDWDASVKSLIPFPELLKMMSDQLDWTQKLGDAFLAQQADVLAATQSLRARATAAGKLQSNTQQTVTHDASAIVIQPAKPETVYVPVYNPTVVYGPWPYPASPPVYYPPPPGYNLGGALATGLAFGTGIAISHALWGWGRPNWGGGNVNVNVNRFNSINSNRYNNFSSNRSAINSNTWQHNPAHRRGVAYNNNQVRQQFRPNQAANTAQRDAFRGRASPDQPRSRQASTGLGGGNAGNAPGRVQNRQQPNGARGGQAAPQGAHRPGGQGGASPPRQIAQRPSSDSAFKGVGQGSATRAQAAQGRSSRATMAQNGGRHAGHAGSGRSGRGNRGGR